MERHETIIIGGGQAGLAMSHQLGRRQRPHLMLERDRLGGRWHSERWDSLHFQFPNWSLRLPGQDYAGDDPEGFSHYSAVVDFLTDYARKIAPPVRLGVDVGCVRPSIDGFRIDTNDGVYQAANVVIASGAFPNPYIPAFASQLTPAILQIHSASYRNPDQLPAGAVLVVGSGSSGGQIAEELQRAGRRVYLSVSRHRRVPRRFLGKDMLWWFYELGWMDRTIDSFPDRRPPAAILLSGIEGGHDLDARKMAADGVTLFGRAIGASGDCIQFTDNLQALLTAADLACAEFVSAACDHARELGMAAERIDPRELPEPQSAADQLDLRSAGISSIVWCTGYRPAFDWIDVPVFDAVGAPIQHRGVTACPGLYFLGLHWMHSFKSGALFGVGDDADYLASRIDC